MRVLALAVLGVLLALASAVSGQLSMSVGPGGQYEYTSIQDAIDAVPANYSGKVIVNVSPGVYREKIVIKKPNITLIGRGARETIITCNEPWLTNENTTVSVLASDFVAKGIAFENTYGRGHQAIAMTVKGDRAAFYHCSFKSFQDTLLDDVGRHYYYKCYIEAGTDFICGNGKSLFEKCHLNSTSTSGGAFTAQRRMGESNDTGYSFVRCRLTGVGVGTAFLGRPWGPYSRVVFALSSISNTVKPVGWDDWATPKLQKTVFYGEFNCSGDGSGTNRTCALVPQVIPRRSHPFLTKAWVDGQDWIQT